LISLFSSQMDDEYVKEVVKIGTEIDEAWQMRRLSEIRNLKEQVCARILLLVDKKRNPAVKCGAKHTE